MANTHAEYLRQLAALQTHSDDWHNIIAAAEEVERLGRAHSAELSARRSSQAHAQKVAAASGEYQSKAESALAAADNLMRTLQLERDALAAQVERLREALRLAKINLAYSEDGFAPQYRNICRKALEATPKTSLASRDARMKAEALEELMSRPGMEHFTASRAAEVLGAAYRKQAEGEA